MEDVDYQLMYARMLMVSEEAVNSLEEIQLKAQVMQKRIIDAQLACEDIYVRAGLGDNVVEFRQSKGTEK